MAVETNLAVFVGEDRALIFTVVDEDEQVIDITDWEVSFVAGAISKTVGDGITLTDPTAGELRVSLEAADLAERAMLEYRLRRTTASQSTVLAFGTFRIRH